jgi:hypothetical protein
MPSPLTLKNSGFTQHSQFASSRSLVATVMESSRSLVATVMESSIFWNLTTRNLRNRTLRSCETLVCQHHDMQQPTLNKQHSEL